MQPQLYLLKTVIKNVIVKHGIYLLICHHIFNLCSLSAHTQIHLKVQDKKTLINKLFPKAILLMFAFITARQRSCGKVMFSQLCVCSRGYITCIMGQVVYPLGYSPPGYPLLLLVSSGSDTPSASNIQWWQMKLKHASYWNAVLFLKPIF